MEKLHRSSVHSLLNPSNDSTSPYNCHTPPSVESTFQEIHTTHIKAPRKRIKLYGVELDVPSDISQTTDLLLKLQDQLLLFSDFGNTNHTYQQQDKESFNRFFALGPFSDNLNSLPIARAHPHKDDQLHQTNLNTTQITQQGFSHSLSNQFCCQLPPLKTDVRPYPGLPNYNTVIPPMTFHNESSIEGDDEEFSSVFLSSLKNGSQPINPRKSKTPTTVSQDSDITFIGPHGHKIKITKIQPSAKDPPKEVKLIVDDPKTNPFTQQWMEHFGELKKFKEQYGHTNVTRSIAGYYNLGNWVAEQRRKFKQGKITESQFNCLNEIGFEWDRSYYFFRTRHKKRDRSSDSDEDDD